MGVRQVQDEGGWLPGTLLAARQRRPRAVAGLVAYTDATGTLGWYHWRPAAELRPATCSVLEGWQPPIGRTVRIVRYWTASTGRRVILRRGIRAGARGPRSGGRVPSGTAHAVDPAQPSAAKGGETLCGEPLAGLVRYESLDFESNVVRMSLEVTPCRRCAAQVAAASDI